MEWRKGWRPESIFIAPRDVRSMRHRCFVVTVTFVRSNQELKLFLPSTLRDDPSHRTALPRFETMLVDTVVKRDLQLACRVGSHNTCRGRDDNVLPATCSRYVR